MLLCLDVGNTQIHGGVFDHDAVRAQFRKSTHPLGSGDELGAFFTAVLREKGIDPRTIARTAICSVVPAAQLALRQACSTYFKSEPFVLQAGAKTGLKVRYRNPLEVGADRIANAIAATQRHPRRDLLIVDCGTATTFDVVNAAGEYLGGAILPGVNTSLDALASHTAKLPRVEIVRPEVALGRSTVESIQAGVFHGQVGAIRELRVALAREAFGENRPWVIGTGGFAWLFEREALFDEVIPELVLLGLKHAELLNRE
ncbi:MAG: type III pantothenate kinase [Verrucomicrobia bacterium]|nr:type III pantothenate kinase [Verrucomicrobiota bacterium]